MKIAYLFFAYKNPELIRRTIECLSGPNCAFIIHVDRKVDIREFGSIRGENVCFTDKRLPVFWGEFSGIEAILILIRQALASVQHYDYLVLLSGSDYPLQSGTYIRQFFEANRGREFMTMVKLPNEKAGKPMCRITTLRCPSTRPVARFAFKLLGKLGLAKRDYRKYFGGLVPYSGSTWWALTRQACGYVVEFSERNRHFTKFFENVFAPEESFFQTILGNSPFKSRMRRGLFFEDWSGGGAHPEMINECHIALFQQQTRIWVQDIHGPGELLFARKFSDKRLDLSERVDDTIRAKEAIRRQLGR